MVYDGGMIDPVIGTLLAGAFALLFASAALYKLRDLPRFGAVLRAYRVLPAGLTFAWPLPLVELTMAAGLLIPLTRAAAALAGAGLLGVYALAMALNLARGRRELACGCGGANERRPISAWMVVRNALLAALLAAISLPWAARPLQLLDLFTVGFGLAVAALLYMSADALLGRVAPRAARWREVP